jgi:outer membrane protein OmpA-like peptidoglycan-associated protein
MPGHERIARQARGQTSGRGPEVQGRRPRRNRVATPLAIQARQLQADMKRSVGRSLDESFRSEMESRFGVGPDSGSTRASLPSGYGALEAHADATAVAAAVERDTRAGGLAADFSGVRLHADGYARSAVRQLGAQAFTIGENVYADPAIMASPRAARDGVIAHELAHVVQQRQLGRTFLQPKLIASGTDADVNRFITLAEAAMGEHLVRDPATNEITAVASLATPATSPAFSAAMHRIIDDPVQNAEAHFGTGQARVAVGAFPTPSDLTGSTEQRIDIDDVEAIEAGAPGNGLGKLAHELTENYEAHAAAPVAGVDRFGPAHEAGVSAESDVAEDTVGPGRRVADVDTPVVGNTFTRVQDFENYYLVFDLTRNPATNDFTVSKARRAPRVNISTTVIDHYVTGSSAVPAAGGPLIAAAAASVAANASATVRIEGFTDSVGSPATNIILSNQRATDAAAALTAAGVGGGRIHTVGLGETRFVAANDNDAHRALNRRVVIIIDRPGP